MKSIYALIRFDLLMQARERGTWLLLAATLLLAGYGLFEGKRFDSNAEAARNGAMQHERTAQHSAQALAARYFANPEAAEFAGQLWFRTPVDIRGYAFREHVGYAVKPGIPGAALTVGQADLLPAYVRVRGESMESVRTAAEIEHPGRLAAGRYDLMFFIIYLWPLILLSLCVSVLTQERESRRLRTLQLQGLTPLHLLLAQVGGRVAAATGLLILFCCGAALAGGAVPASAAGLGALASWSLIVLAYSAFWGAVALAICALCGNRMNASFAAFGAWLVFTVVLPGVLSTVIQLGAPMPNREYYVQAMRDAGDKVAADKLNSLARFYDSHPEWRPARTALDKVSSSVSRIQRAQELEQAMLGVEQTFEDARLRRDALFGRAMVFSPVTLAYEAFSHVAGNDQQRQQRFIAEVQQHHTALRGYFQHAIQTAALADEQSACTKTCAQGYGFSDFAAVPRFTPSAALAQAPPVPARFGMILAWIAALGGLAWLILRHFARHRSTM
jgi:ABC-2 type transport system permease protein